MIENISFVVIARNEEFALPFCIEALEDLNCSDCEFIFIDSNSSDNSLELMKNFKPGENKHSVIRISGELNASVARNTGLEVATKEFMFFIDGDTAIHGDFIKKSLDVFHEQCDVLAIQGRLKEIVYDIKTRQQTTVIEDRYHVSNDSFTLHTGGIFITRTNVAKEENGFNENFIVNEDYEFSLRISKRGKIFLLNQLMGTHNTFPYDSRLYPYFQKGLPKYTGILLRKNLNRIDVVKEILKSESGIFTGVLFYLCLILFSTVNIFISLPLHIIIPALSIFLMLDIVRGLLRKQNIMNRFIIRVLFPIHTIRGFFTPIGVKPKKKEIQKLIQR